MPRIPFDWSELDTDTLYNIFNEAQQQIVGRKLFISEIHKILSKQVKKYLPICVRMTRDPANDPGLVYIGGGYYSDYDKKNKERYIEIVFSYHMFDESITITRYRWVRMCSLFADTILHELIHLRQYRTRKFKSLPGYESTAHLAKQRRDQNYYGHPDEVGAYAFNIACELFERFGYDFSRAKQYIDSNQPTQHKKSTYLRYLTTFDLNHNHKIIKKLKKKVMFYLPYAALGKPFKTPDYLTY